MLQKDILIFETESIKNTLKKLDKTAEKVLLIVDQEKRLLGAITDGDIRRYLLKGKSLENCIRKVYNKKPIYIKTEDYSLDKVKKILIKNKVGLLPILDQENKVIDFITWNQAFSEKIKPIKKSKVDIPVVIMAGGEGTRLEPFTKILPKPLVPIGDKPIIEVIIEEFKRQGIKEYYLTLNYKGEMIESYFNCTEKDYEIKYLWENDFLGTAGGLKLLLEERIGDTFIVSNCDVIVKANFEEVINLHKKQNALLTILSSIQHYKIPYGVIKFKKRGEVTDIFEKPEHTITINTGVYILTKESLQFIPEKSYFDMTDLIENLIKNDKKVITYPVNENDYIDIGQWEEYKKAVERLQLLR